jgi:hypothetical protein
MIFLSLMRALRGALFFFRQRFAWMVRAASLAAIFDRG